MLSERQGKDPGTVRAWLDTFLLPKKQHTPRSCVLIFDATYFGKQDGILVARDPNERENIFAEEIVSETKAVYENAKREVESLDYLLQAVVLDGRRGVPRVFEGIPIQICQFHQLQIVRRKLTLRPETDAGKDLLAIGMSISRLTEERLTKLLVQWEKKYHSFLNEKTYVFGCNRWHYTHRRVRSAYRSLVTNLPYLFTYQKYPELNIPNTTNSLDGYFSRVKNLLSAHRGQTQERRWKMIRGILKI